MTANPYPGLRSFEAGDSELFFGREDETDELRRRLRASRFLAVVGGSGSGKSSLVRCGLLPSLHAGLMSGGVDDWRVAIMRPGDDPIGALAATLDQPGVLRCADVLGDTRRAVLAASLRDSSLGLAETVRQAALPAGARLLLLVDQFEELFRYRRLRPAQAGGADDAGAFVQLLLEASRSSGAQVYVVLTMRAEFTGDCMAFAGLAEAINGGQYLIPRMSRDAMRRAIGGPAAVRGAAIAPRLMVRLLNEVGDELDRLPVLQHALMRTWQAWEHDHAEGEPLDVRHYEAIGTTREALARHAEEAWAALGGAGAQALAERLWKALTETTEEGRGIRRPTTLASLLDICATTQAELVHVIEVFRGAGRGMLQPPADVALGAGSVVDITHESLMRLWPRLADWTRQEARARDIYRRLLRSARQHQAGEAGLWRPPELTLGLTWQAENRPNAAWAGDPQACDLALGFLRRSQRARWWRNTAIVSVVVAAVGLVIGGLTYDARRSAQLADAKRLGLEARQRELEREASLGAELAAARERELEARRNEVLALIDQVKRLTDAQAEGVVGREQELAQVLALRSDHATLTARVATLDKQRLALEDTIAKALEANRSLEQDLVTLGIEQRHLDQQLAAMRAERERNDLQQVDLSNRLAALTPVPAILATQTAALQGRHDDLAQVNQKLASQVRDMRRCFPTAAAAASPTMGMAAADLDVAVGAVAPPMPRPTLQEPPWPIGLRQQVEALARELAALLDERARLQDEAAFLGKATALLRAQLAVMDQEIRALTARQAYLQQTQAQLKQDVQAARSERDSASAAVAEFQNTLEDQRQRLSQLRDAHAAMERRTIDESGHIASLERGIKRLQANIVRDTAYVRAVVDPLTGAARDTAVAKDLSALFAVLAYRWTPDNPDDPAHPEVYNTLWQALHRIDAPAAMALVAPVATGKPGNTKLATTTSAALVNGLCQRVARPITQTEWSRHVPDSACYSSDLADPCKDR